MKITPSCEFASFFQREVSANEVENPLGTNGTMSNASIVDALFGRGIEFTGANNSWVDFGNYLQPGTSDLTIMVKFKVTSSLATDANGGRVIHTRGGGALGSTSGFQICVKRSGTNVLLDNTVFDSGTGSSNTIGITSYFGAHFSPLVVGQTGEWIDLKFILDRGDRLKVYSGAELLLNGDISSISLGNINTSRPLVFGSNKTSQPIPGIVDSAVIWYTSLPETDIRRLISLMHPLNG